MKTIYDAEAKQSVTDCNQLGNAAKMREALNETRRFVLASAQRADRDLLVSDEKRGVYVLTPKDTLVKIDAAISAPPRNCDVGTAEEQSERFDAHCRKHMGCLTCPLREKDGGVPKYCEFVWSQMPYEEGGARWAKQ